MQVKLNLFCPARFEADIPQQIGRGFAEYDHEPRPIQVWHDGGEALPMDDVEDLGDASCIEADEDEEPIALDL